LIVTYRYAYSSGGHHYHHGYAQYIPYTTNPTSPPQTTTYDRVCG
jgi:hypothetical protein